MRDPESSEDMAKLEYTYDGVCQKAAQMQVYGC